MVFLQLERELSEEAPDHVIRQLEEELAHSQRQLKDLEISSEATRRRQKQTLRRFGAPPIRHFIFPINLSNQHRINDEPIESLFNSLKSVSFKKMVENIR